MSTTPAAMNFSQSYAEARAKFLIAAHAAGLTVESHAHPLTGRDGEPLAMDVVRDGPADARAVLLLSSACHGVEGYCGSGIQIALLQDAALRAQAHAAGVALLVVHGLNPWGFSWWRRTTHENVDLNRNFHDFGQPLPANPAYAELAALIVPDTWPPTPEVNAQTMAWIGQHGPKAWQAAVSAGQHTHPDGLFHSGREPTWSNRTVRAVLAQHGRQCARLGWIDFHTGLGPNGHGERILSTADDAAALGRARAWWGPAITSTYDGSSTSAALTGTMFQAAYDECPQAEYTGIALEYGTEPLEVVLQALRADQWLMNHPDTPAEVAAPIKRAIRDAFYTDTDGWKAQVLAQGIEATQQAVAGLAG